MSDTNQTEDQGQWGRPTKRKNKGVKALSSTSGAGPAVGPVDHPVEPSEAGTIIRNTTPPRAPAYAPTRREPEAVDLKLRDLVVHVARGLVDRPDDVSVEFLSVTPAETSLELRVHPDDLGHVIGKLGRTANSVRLTLGAAAAKLGRRANLEIAD